MRRLLITSAVCLTLNTSLRAQVWDKAIPAPPNVPTPLLKGDDGNAVSGVRLTRADVRAAVHGTIARATLTLTFANDQPRVLGGNLVFPLPEGATVTGYGLEVNGQMVDGVAVEKEQARLIYETEIHKPIAKDPGLVEHVQGNAFRTRLYPVPANGMRSIKIEYVTQLDQAQNGATLALPLGVRDVIDEMSVHIDAPDATSPPTINFGGIQGMKFVPSLHGFAADGSARGVTTGSQLVVAFSEMPRKTVAVETRQKYARTIEELDGQKRHDDAKKSENYFLVTDTPTPTERPAVQLKNHRIGVVWGAGLTRGQAEHARELKLLAGILERLGHPAADLVILRNDVEVKTGFDHGAAGSARLVDTIKSLNYDGATNLGALTFPKNASGYGVAVTEKPADYDLYLMFSDGMGNIGDDRPQRAEVPVYAMSDDLMINHALLHAFCQESGGNYFNLKIATDQHVLTGVGDAPFNLVSIDCNPDEITEVYPKVGTAIHGRLMLSGKLLAPQAKLTLHYGYGTTAVSRETFTVSAEGATEGTLLPRLWAHKKETELALSPQKNADEITQIGKQFNLVTPNTSLLVLETADQYVQYRVVPPPSRQAIYQQFMQQIEFSRAQVAQTQEQKVQQVVALWNQRRAWSETKFREYVPPKPATWSGGGDAGPLASGSLIETSNVGGTIEINPAAAENTANADRLDFNTGLIASDGASIASGLAVSPDSQDGDGNEAGGGVMHRIDAQPSPVKVQTGPAIAAVPGSAPSQNGQTITVSIKPWDPNTPYITAMMGVAPERAYDTYLAQRQNYAHSPAFYFDSADYLCTINQKALGVRVLTDIVALELHDARLLRVAAHRLIQIGQRELAIDLFEKVLQLKPEEPQSYRDLALALADRADAVSADLAAGKRLDPSAESNAQTDYLRAMLLLNKVVVGNWPRFPEVELPVLMEANDIAFKAQRLPHVHDFHNPLDPRLQKNLDCDVRVVMTWDSDQTDIDLWVTEPTGEKCFYGHNRTNIGGLLSRDCTDGYGPEEYCLRRLWPGQYNIQANFYGSRQQELTGPTTVQATVITNFGRPSERRQALSLRLKNIKEVAEIGTVTLDEKGQAQFATAAGASLSEVHGPVLAAYLPPSASESPLSMLRLPEQTSWTWYALMIAPWVALFGIGMVASWRYSVHRVGKADGTRS